MVLTLLEVLPPEVPIVVCETAATRAMWSELFPTVNRSRLLPFNRAATYFASRLYSVIPSPYGAHGKHGGEPLSMQAATRFRSHLPAHITAPRPRDTVLVISRGDRGNRRCTTHDELIRRLEAALAPRWKVVSFVGTKQSQLQNARLWARARLVVGPHGGAYMNLPYAQPGTPVVEIGYDNTLGRKAMPFPPYYMVRAHKLSLPYWLVLSKGSYVGPIECDVEMTVQTARAAINQSTD